MLYHDRASVLATLVVLGLMLAGFLHIPTWTHALDVLGSPLTIRVTQQALMAVLLVAMTFAGTEAIIRSHPTVQREGGRHTFVTWTVPGLTTLLAVVLIPRAPTQLYRLSGLLATGFVLILIVSAEYYSLDLDDRRYRTARMLLNGWAYALALAAFVMIYSAKARSLISASGVILVSTPLALEFLRGAGQGFGRTALYASIAGLATGEIVWAMNYWRLGGITGGLILLLGFYVATGVANQQLQGRLTRRVLLEYGIVTLVGLVVLLQFGP